MHDAVDAGQAAYTPAVLRVYDLLVLGISNRWIWRCPTGQILDLYNRHATGNHLDAGVGTGYFLDRCRFPTPQPRLTLLDLNEHCLRAAARRIQRYSPQTFQADLLAAETPQIGLFDSISCNYVLHCLPGNFESKACVLDKLHALLHPAGVLFGATLLHLGVPRNWAARQLMDFYNRRRIFSNRGDSPTELQSLLELRFSAVDVSVVGCAALFVARK